MKLTAEDLHQFKRVLKLFQPYTKKIVIILACILISAGISMILPVVSKKIMDDGLLKQNLHLVVMLSLITLGFILLDQGISLWITKDQSYINSMMTYHLSKTAFKHTLKLKLQYFNQTNFSEIMSNINMDVGNIARISDRSTFFIITSLFKFIGGIVGLLLIDWKLTLLVVWLVPLRYWLVKYLARKRMRLFEKLMQYSKEYYAWYGDAIEGVKEIKLWGLERMKTGEFIRKQRSLVKTNIQLAFIDRVNELSETVLFQLITSSLYILGAYLAFKNSFTIGGLFAFITYSVYVTGPISAIINLGYSFSNVLPSARRFFGFLDMECEDDNHEVKSFNKDLAPVTGDITFENVSFSYRLGEATLKDVSLEIKRGERIAIVGPNGSGKTTISVLLLRFYHPDSGRILLNGTDIRKFKLRNYRKLFSVVSQDLYLFNTTIEENIALKGKARDSRVSKAAQESGACRFIETLPQKYQSMVGRNGSGLSGGERQKVAMARAFARDAKILILDEATSNYDRESESMVNELLSKNFDDKTMIIISHKPDILKRVDRIVLVKDKRIQYIGTFEELQKRDNLYRFIIDATGDESTKRVV